MKYHNHKVTFQGETFDSQAEMARYIFLQNRQKEGKIEGLRRQVEYLLIPNQYRPKIVQLKTKTKIVDKLIERECKYVADFVYMRNGRMVVEDVKGADSNGSKSGKGGRAFSTQTADFKIKKKLLLYVHDIQVQIVTSPTQWNEES